jgi:hypothetical protein
MSMTKPKKATKSVACPHLAVAFEGGGNWGWAYYDTLQKAKEVTEWVKAGTNTKFLCGGRVDSIDEAGTATKDGSTLWCVHYHYDNTRRPAYIPSVPNIRTLWK